MKVAQLSQTKPTAPSPEDDVVHQQVNVLWDVHALLGVVLDAWSIEEEHNGRRRVIRTAQEKLSSALQALS